MSASLKFNIEITPDPDTILAGGFTPDVLAEAMAKATCVIPELVEHARGALLTDRLTGNKTEGITVEELLEHTPSKTRVLVTVTGTA